MRYRALDRDGDYTSAFLADSVECVLQAVKTRLLLWLGEWFLDTTDGTDWSGKILGENTRGTYQREIKARILDTPGVTQITRIDFQLADRALSVQATVSTVYGTGTVTI